MNISNLNNVVIQDKSLTNTYISTVDTRGCENQFSLIIFPNSVLLEMNRLLDIHEVEEFARENFHYSVSHTDNSLLYYLKMNLIRLVEKKFKL